MRGGGDAEGVISRERDGSLFTLVDMFTALLAAAIAAFSYLSLVSSKTPLSFLSLIFYFIVSFIIKVYEILHSIQRIFTLILCGVKVAGRAYFCRLATGSAFFDVFGFDLVLRLIAGEFRGNMPFCFFAAGVTSSCSVMI